MLAGSRNLLDWTAIEAHGTEYFRSKTMPRKSEKELESVRENEFVHERECVCVSECVCVCVCESMRESEKIKSRKKGFDFDKA